MAHPSIQELTVHVTNKLSSKMLIVHCRSGDDDLGAHCVEIGAEFRWSFKSNAMATTLFWCSLAVEDKRLSFVAYGDEVPYFFEHWSVYDGGLYGKDIRTGGERFMGAWRRIWLP
ncbi:unnamed protein product [Linum tenue]|uniref:S-protein homolog n=2 Tax=Linum tenue TaxID=586396 RepID=A0AAV0KY87_9ROSI|nr:unnamed protein product [Linum tenue]